MHIKIPENQRDACTRLCFYRPPHSALRCQNGCFKHTVYGVLPLSVVLQPFWNFNGVVSPTMDWNLQHNEIHRATWSQHCKYKIILIKPNWRFNCAVHWAYPLGQQALLRHFTSFPKQLAAQVSIHNFIQNMAMGFTMSLLLTGFDYHHTILLYIC